MQFIGQRFLWLPTTITKTRFAHGWWTNDGQRISKSLGNAIDPNHLSTIYGLDQTRYFVARGAVWE